MTFRFVAKFLIGAALLLPLHFANAQGLPASVVSDFLANPGLVLTLNPTGGPALTKQVRDLIGTDKNTLPTVMELVKTANQDQQMAIADGLAQAAKTQARNDPGFANQIQAAVAATGLPEFIKQYASIAGDTGTAATGGGGGTGGGGPNNAGAPTGGQNNGPFTNPNSFVANNFSNPFTSTSLGGSSFSVVNNNSVSPQ